jgi:thiopeptide-type bacteriocin biosynthesis protein
MELAMVSTADLLASLAANPAERARVCKNAAGSAVQSGVVFRDRQARLRELITALSGSPGPADGVGHPFGMQWPCVRDALADRRARLAPLAEQLRARHLDGTGLRPVEELAPSILHMHANRLGLDPANESLMLGLLDRALRSVRAYPGPLAAPRTC